MIVAVFISVSDDMAIGKGGALKLGCIAARANFYEVISPFDTVQYPLVSDRRRSQLCIPID